MEWLYLCSMRMYVALIILFFSTLFARADSFVRFEEKVKSDSRMKLVRF